MKDFLDPHGRRVAWLLTELEHQTENRLPEESRQNLLNEVASHLDAAIRARLELGMEPLQAEREAVELFGKPEAYVDELLAIHQEPASTRQPTWWWLVGDKRAIVTLWLGSICATAMLIVEQGDLQSHALWLVGVATALLLSVFSYRARRIQVLPIIFSTLGIYLVWCAVILLWAKGLPNLESAIDLIIHTAFAIPISLAFTLTINVVCATLGFISQPEVKRLQRRIT